MTDTAIASALDAVTQTDAAGSFTNAGYPSPQPT
jgi:hypothetical protein